MSDVYSPKDHGGLTRSGEPDKRLSPEHGFGGDRKAASEAGKKVESLHPRTRAISGTLAFHPLWWRGCTDGGRRVCKLITCGYMAFSLQKSEGIRFLGP